MEVSAAVYSGLWRLYGDFIEVVWWFCGGFVVILCWFMLGFVVAYDGGLWWLMAAQGPPDWSQHVRSSE